MALVRLRYVCRFIKRKTCRTGKDIPFVSGRSNRLCALQGSQGWEIWDTGRERDKQKAAAKANFDCVCGYNPACQVSDNLYDNDLTDCIYLCQELDYPDVMKQLVSEWKDTVMKDTDSDRACLIRFHQFLGMEEENGPLYQAQLLSATETGRISDLARAYIDMIRHETV